MEFKLSSKQNVFPCEVTIDEDNGRYTIRKPDSCGEIFNTPQDLILWVLKNWSAEQFCDESQFHAMVREMELNYPFIN
ncbi:hypothetical protein DS745_03325 [Anaerobacillus alkaliphilus]|uniref:Threonine dehydratase n=1 Tax=Anaerobacillus alkaliphilus TaxID=1548597 RepID=A0A4Q0VY76_9BACI|nr:hypothetical protein [Anaerobacillus alkaliphilus]RXJ04430.1 hypothetical protein DS745_03325 [Anaerobacillus alkaliphilus]